MSMFNSSPIRSRVIKAVNAKIDQAEKVFLENCLEIDRKAEIQKSEMLDTMVSDIIGKII